MKASLLLCAVALFMQWGCETQAPPPVPSIRTLSRVGSPTNRFAAVFTRIDAGLDDFIYQLHVVGFSKAAEGEPAVELRDLDWSKPIEIEWKGDTKILLKFGGAAVRGYQEVVEAVDDNEKSEQIAVMLIRE